MTREQMACNILFCGIKHGQKYIDEALGQEVDRLVRHTFGELHKNNTPEEAFVFLLVGLFKRNPTSLNQECKFERDVSAEKILEHIKAGVDFRNERRLDEISDVRLKAVLDDFIYILAKQFFYQPEIYERIIARLKIG